ncbi:MAG: tetratricopeptide repeat protein [Calditrichaeota bacterium]|nr:tetratricopeptide repeat protein [Calditrichota bacterium]HQU71683.1 tetratricopeptide repeat protein [Calditrichia bacterium]
MAPQKDIYPIALTTRKWDLDGRRLYLQCPVIWNMAEYELDFDIQYGNAPDMVDTVLTRIRELLAAQSEPSPAPLTINNEPFVRKKLLNHFKRFLTEVNNNRRKKPVGSTHLAFFPEDQELGFLPREIQFFVVFNRARKISENEDWKKSIDPLRHAISLRPDFGQPYKLLARSLKKIRHYEEAMATYQKYAEVDDSLDAWLDLAKSLRKGKQFDNSEKIYHRVLERFPAEREARIGLAQIYFSTKQVPEKYLTILEALYDEDPAWLKGWLTAEFNFRIYVPEKEQLSPNQAVQYLGLSEIAELTKMAFKNDVPSHFNPAKARLTFFREELEGWALVMNRFDCLRDGMVIHPEHLNGAAPGGKKEKAPAEPAAQESAPAPAKSNGKPTRVEEILAAIRARKAERMGQNGRGNAHHSPEMAPEEPARKRSSRQAVGK